MLHFTTIISKYPGKCRRCGERFDAGSKIRYGGRGLTYHLKADCEAGFVAPSRPVMESDPVDRAYEDDCARVTGTDQEFNF